MDESVRRYLEVIDAAYQTRPLAEVKTVITDCMDQYAANYGTDNLGYGCLVNELGAYARGLGRLEECEELFQKAVTIVGSAAGLCSGEYATALSNLASVYRLKGDVDAAENLLVQAKEIYEHEVGTQHVLYAGALNSIGLLYQQTGGWKEALEAHQRAWEIIAALGNDSDMQAVTLCNLANAERHLGNAASAEAKFMRAIQIYQTPGMEHSPHHFACWNNLGILYFEEKRYEQAKMAFENAKNWAEKIYGTAHRDTQAILRRLEQTELRMKAEAGMENLST